MMLLLPEQKNPEQVAEFHDREKLFEVLDETESWGRQLEVPTVGALDDVICKGKASELILMQEALMEKKIGDIAEQIASLLRKNDLFPSPFYSAKGKRLKAASHCGGQLLCQPGRQPAG